MITEKFPGVLNSRIKKVCIVHESLVLMCILLGCPWKVRADKALGGSNPPGGGELSYEREGDACWKFWIKPLEETNLGMAQAFFFTPKWDHFKTCADKCIFLYFFVCNPKQDLYG